MLKMMTIVGTRPELINQHINPVLAHDYKNFDYELNQVFINGLDISKPDYFPGAVGNSAAYIFTRVNEKADEAMEKKQPDALLHYGDTYSCSSVIAEKRRKIPMFHMEAGDHCFDQRVPAAKNPHIHAPGILKSMKFTHSITRRSRKCFALF